MSSNDRFDMPTSFCPLDQVNRRLVDGAVSHVCRSHVLEGRPLRLLELDFPVRPT